MTNQRSYRRRAKKLPWMLIVLFVVPATLFAHPEVDDIDALDASLDESPFDDFEPLDGFETSPSGIAPIPDVGDLERGDNAEPPDAAVSLRFDFDQTKTYKIRNGLRIHYDHPGDFAPVYQSGLFVEYYPIDADTRDEMSYWPVDIDTEAGDADDDGRLVRVTVGGALGVFDEPEAFSNTTSVHPLLRNATLTFRITDRGAIDDVRIHPPTNPLLRSSIEEVIRLLAASHPPLPDDDVNPGDEWTQTVEWSAQDDTGELEHSVQLHYIFERWAPCDDAFCAIIDVKKDVEAAGIYRSGTLQTDSSSVGDGAGRIVFDANEGRVVDAQWNLDARTATLTTRKNDPDSAPVNDFGFDMEVDTAITLF